MAAPTAIQLRETHSELYLGKSSGFAHCIECPEKGKAPFQGLIKRQWLRSLQSSSEKPTQSWIWKKAVASHIA
ncbi:hypothetical protein LQ50_16595 [Halalkalibacter okhensis]|uniref:Uncharacterized protein n=1 Tax=Halalkalibacter okhensis TaxID=333138 RepID=A0A0B0IHM0_9BACI|nr:hypothetical protein LQ50_16595 [Halalkalibacter okhensis]